MNVRALVASEPDKTHLARLLRFQHSFPPPVLGKNTVWIRISDHFVELQQLDSIGLQPSQRFVELDGCSGFGSTVDLGHQKGPLAITVTKGFSHSNFALSAVVVPAVIEKIDSFIDSGSNNPDALCWIALLAQVITAEPDHRNVFPGAAQRAIWNPILTIRRSKRAQRSGHQKGCGSHTDKLSPVETRVLIHAVLRRRLIGVVRGGLIGVMFIGSH